MPERRNSPRASCRLQGRILKGRDRVRVRIIDVSESGLCLISPVWMKPKQEVEVEIDVPNVGVSKLRAEIWHIRREKSRHSNNKVWIAGVMVTDADPSYDRLLHSAGVSTDAVLEADESTDYRNEAFASVLRESKPVGAAESEDPVEATDHRVFRIRCKARGGPRTRVLTVAAESVEHAETLATRDLGETWTVLEVREA